jgi:type IV pilus assembly protein PilY1
MLHAFDATSGLEQWAYIPGAVIPNLYKLADAAYAGNHQYYVDGPIVVGDAYNGSAWRSILVGGLARGGRGYYALDVTDPANPVALWEFGTAQDVNVGYSYGNPVLTKRASDGRWVVLVASGYNNVSPGDGMPHLYVLDAFTGAKLSTIDIGSASTDPNLNGIAKIANWVDNTLIDNTTQYVYAGDLGGNLWRFDLSASSVQRLGYTSATPGDQPITVRPELARVKDSAGIAYMAVFFGTGRYLGFTDVQPSSPSQSVVQSVYAVKDTGTDLGVLSASSAKLVAQTLNSSTSPRTIASPAAVDWATDNGWYMNLPVGERINVDPSLQLGTFVIASNVPDTNYCTVGGTSWLYALNYSTGGPVSTAQSAGNGEQIVGTFTGSALTVGLSLLQLPGGKVVALVSTSDTKVNAASIPVAPAAAVSPRRLGWREIN